MKIATIRNRRIESICVADDNISEEEFALLSVALLRGDEDRSVRALRPDEEHLGVGFEEMGEGSDARWYEPSIPIEERIAQIDAQTSAKVVAGAAFAGVTISTSLAAQVTLLLASFDAQTFPMMWPTADGKSVEIADAKAFAELRSTVSKHVLDARSEGVARKAEASAEAAQAVLIDGGALEPALEAKAETFTEKR